MSATVTYHSNYPTSATDITSVDTPSAGSYTVAAADKFTCTGYKITGWALSAKGSALFEPGEETDVEDGESYNYYAVWAKDESSSSEDDNPSQPTSDKATVTYDANTTTLKLPSGGTKTITVDAGTYTLWTQEQLVANIPDVEDMLSTNTLAGWQYSGTATTEYKPGATVSLTAGETYTYKAHYISKSARVNKVVYNGNTLIDLTLDTATPDDVISGRIFHSKSGQMVEGTLGAATTTSLGLVKVGDNLSIADDGTLSAKGGEIWKTAKTAGEFYKADDAPTSTDVCKLDGYLYATKVYNAVWNDYAELFKAGEHIDVGHVAYVHSDGLVYASGDSDSAVGVVSDQYGYLCGGNGDPDDDSYVAIALAGRVPVEVTNSDSLHIGSLVSATTSGKAHSADLPNDFGSIIGKCVGKDPKGRANYVYLLVGVM